MSALKMKLVKLSVCECGFPLLDDRIRAGTDYYANGDRVAQGVITCGGCGKTFGVEMIFVHEKRWPWGTSEAGFMPSAAFEPWKEDE